MYHSSFFQIPEPEVQRHAAARMCVHARVHRRSPARNATAQNAMRDSPHRELSLMSKDQRMSVLEPPSPQARSVSAPLPEGSCRRSRLRGEKQHGSLPGVRGNPPLRPLRGQLPSERGANELIVSPRMLSHHRVSPVDLP
ncbi:hypothetical protein BBSC_0443 [Bifidobacterium scardovii JCM 12489 = DSM 13734]|nr:hypothetical protein BBSC_0443 [Bifidobacterium scardovii JCM 12489 = DSM 13734]